MSKSDSNPSFNAMPYLAGSQNFVMAAARLQAQACKAAMRYQIEVLDFMKHRVEQDMKLVDDLAASDELNDAVDVMASFMQTAANEYTSEAGKLADIGSSATAETVRHARRQADRMSGDGATATGT